MEIGELMDAIVRFDCQPSVWQVTIVKSDHRSGFDAVVEFRSTHKDSLRSISAHDDDPKKALETVYNQLKEKWGKCPHCGEYRSERFQL